MKETSSLKLSAVPYEKDPTIRANKIRLQTKDDAIARPDGPVRKLFELRGTNNLKESRLLTGNNKTKKYIIKYQVVV